MLRFDLPPVYSNVARVQASITLAVCILVFLGYPYFAFLTLAMGIVRGFVSSRKCPSHLAIEAVLIYFGIQGKKENAGAKMFADKLLACASAVILIIWSMGGSFYLIPAGALGAFALADLLFGFCIACWAFNAWHSRNAD